VLLKHAAKVNSLFAFMAMFRRTFNGEGIEIKERK